MSAKKLEDLLKNVSLQVNSASDKLTVLSEIHFGKFSKLIYDLAGVDLPSTPKNHALIQNRLMKILKSRGFSSYQEYWKLLESHQPQVLQEFIESLTTNMTSFYREPVHFDFLAEQLAKLHIQEPEVRIWCAAASTGQEPYTIAITAREKLNEFQAMRTRILATDIDTQVLKKGSLGIYDEKEMEGLSIALREKYFEPKIQDGKKNFQSKKLIHQMVRFAPFNLVHSSPEFKNPFHLIFCRNVLIYFDPETVGKVIDKLASTLAPGGFLILGHSESGNLRHPQLKPLSRAIFQKVS